MSGNDDTKDGSNAGFNLDDLDWDAALNEWEQKTFVPEVAVDKETKAAGMPITPASTKMPSATPLPLPVEEPTFALAPSTNMAAAPAAAAAEDEQMDEPTAELPPARPSTPVHRPASLSANPPRIVPRASSKPGSLRPAKRASSSKLEAARVSQPPATISEKPAMLAEAPTRVVAMLPDDEALTGKLPPTTGTAPPTPPSDHDETVSAESLVAAPASEPGQAVAVAVAAPAPSAPVIPPAAPTVPRPTDSSMSTLAAAVSPSTREKAADPAATMKQLAGSEDDDENTALFGRIFREEAAAKEAKEANERADAASRAEAGAQAPARPTPRPPPSSPTQLVTNEQVQAMATASTHELDSGDGELQVVAGDDDDDYVDDGQDVDALIERDETSRPSLHSPPERTHDPDAVTNMVVLEELLGVGGDESDATRMRVRNALEAGSEDEPAELRPAPVFEDEKPAAQYFDESMRATMAERARRIEAEARTRRDPRERARGLLVASELLAMIGERDEASGRANEAREIAPAMSLAHAQARTLGWEDRSASTRVTDLDAESRSSATLDGQVHALLLAADVLRAQGDEEAAADRWEQATRLIPTDVRAPIARATRALSRGDLTAATLLVGALPPALGSALSTALLLRGHEEATDGDIPANDSLRRARAAFDRSEIEVAAKQIAEIRSIPELAPAATWLASMVGATKPASRAESAQLLKPLAFKGDAEARRTLAARIVELNDATLGDELLSEPEPFAPAEWSTISFLLGLSGGTSALLDTVNEASPALGSALAAVTPKSADDNANEARRARAGRTAGEPSARKLVTLGRLLADAAPADEIAAAIAALGTSAPESVRAVGLELALRAGRFDEVADALRTWLAEDETAASGRDRQLAAALVAEHTPPVAKTDEDDDDKPSVAVEAYRAALTADRSDMAALRALMALDPGAAKEAARSLVGAAEERGGAFAAAARIEAAARVTGDEARREMILSEAHRAAPELALAAMLAERAARRSKDGGAVLQWLREQRELATDPLEQALVDVRHALAAATGNDADRALAAERLAEAHRAFPSDVALRELYERFASDADSAPSDRAAWRETRGAQATGPSRVLYFLEAAHEYERAGDREAALRAAKAAYDSGDQGLARLALERAEEASGDVARRVETLTKKLETSDDARERTETMERLADLEASGRKDVRASIAWHRKIALDHPMHLASLRALEHGLIGLERDEKEEAELGTVAAEIARATAKASPFEASAHAQLAVRVHLKQAHPWEETRQLTELAAALPSPAIWALRMADGHARAAQDDTWQLATTETLIERTTQSSELAFLHVRAGEAALRLQKIEEAGALFEKAASEDAGDIVAWGRLAEVRRRLKDLPGSGDALESLARTSLVPTHQRAAWVAAAVVWLDDLHDEERGVSALEQAARADLGTDEVFNRLVQLYTKRQQRQELAELLERRVSAVKDPAERATLEVQRGRALAEVGDFAAASTALESALDIDPDNLAALTAYAEVAIKRADWGAAETTLVQLARLVSDPEDQKAIYIALGDLYADKLGNLGRAETAMNEVLKRAPEDIATLEKLAVVYRKQKDASRAIEVQTQLVALSMDPSVRRKRMLEMASIHDVVGGDARRAEQVLEAARKESPLDVGVLRALVEFYERHKQGPAVNVLLDRVGGDARRAITAGKVVPAQLEQLVAVYELRGRQASAGLVTGALNALRNEPSPMRGAEGRALSPELDDLLAPELLSASLRVLLARAGDSLDVAAPVDLRAYKAAALPASAAPFHQAVLQLAATAGITQIQLLASPAIGMSMMPCLSSPATILVGEAVLGQPNERARLFLAARVLKVAHAHASTLIRTPGAELNVLVSAWLNLFNPSWRPESIPAAQLGEAARKIKAGLPRQLPPELSFAALEVAGAVAPQMMQLGPATLTWANRVALLAIGDLSAGFDAIAWTSGLKAGAPTAPTERAAWIANNPEARDLLAFSVGDVYAEARAKLRL